MRLGYQMVPQHLSHNMHDSLPSDQVKSVDKKKKSRNEY